MDIHIFEYLYNELKMLHLLEENTSIVSVEESVGTFLFIVGHNTDFQLTCNHFKHSLETIQRQFRHALHGYPCIGMSHHST